MNCRYCQKQLGNNPILEYGMFPMTPNAIENDLLKDQNGNTYAYEFTIIICSKCGLIQQLNQPNPDILYFRFKNETTGKKWKQHFQEFSEFVFKNYCANQSILEIGAGDLQLTNMLIEKGMDSITVVEKNIDVKHYNPKILFIFSYLEEVNFVKKFDIVYSSHVFEHISNISVHLQKISTILNVGGSFIFSLPNFEKWIENFYLNSFNQEHVIYPLAKNIEMMLNHYGFHIKNLSEFEQHSLFIEAEYTGQKIFEYQDESIYETNLALLNNFKDKLQKFERFINDKVIICKQIYVFGANSSTQLLLKKLKHKQNIICILDNATIKENKFLYGFDYVVKKPEILQSINNPEESYILIFTGTYVDEIKEQLLQINKKLNIVTMNDFLNTII